MDIGSAVGRAKGVTDEQLRDIHRYRESGAFSPLEKLVLELAEGLSRSPAEVPDELFAALREHLDEKQLIELAAMVALENFRSRFNRTFDVAPQGYSEGAYCVLPAPEADGA